LLYSEPKRIFTLLCGLLLMGSVVSGQRNRDKGAEQPDFLIEASIDAEDYEEGAKFTVLSGEKLVAEIAVPVAGKPVRVAFTKGYRYTMICVVPEKETRFITVDLDSASGVGFVKSQLSIGFSLYSKDEFYERENELFSKFPVAAFYYSPSKGGVVEDLSARLKIREALMEIRDRKMAETVKLAPSANSADFRLYEEYPAQSSLVIEYLIFDYLNGNLVRDFSVSVATDGNPPQQFELKSKIALLLGLNTGHSYTVTISSPLYADVHMNFDFRKSRSKDKLYDSAFIVMVANSPENHDLVEKLTSKPLYIGKTGKRGRPGLDREYTAKFFEELEALVNSDQPFILD
jgi:hypothetical protein